MYAEQICTAKIPVNMFGGYGKVLVFLFRLEYSRGKKARCSKTCTSMRYSFQRLRRCIEYICSACTLNMYVNKKDIKDEDETYITPSTNFTVIRMKRDILDRSNLGIIFLNKQVEITSSQKDKVEQDLQVIGLAYGGAQIDDLSCF